MNLIVRNVRSLVGEHKIEIRPLTVLVGENSAGKSTVLGMMNAATSLAFPHVPVFNDPPYDFGNFDSIVTCIGGRSGRKGSFSLGYEGNTSEGHSYAAGEKYDLKIVATYQSRDARPALSELELVVDNEGLIIQADAEKYTASKYTRLDTGEVHNGEVISGKIPDGLGTFHWGILFQRDLFFRAGSGLGLSERFRSGLRLVTYGVNHLFGQTLSVAPVRTRPQRTYDILDDSFDPEGDHIPSVLVKFLGSKQQTGRGEEVALALKKFGKDSGMFKSITVKKYDPKTGYPFRVLVGDVGIPRAIVDVGYGVSQALPVIVEGALVRTHQRLLLQQPEVHLHPRAQAALGTFLSEMVGLKQRQFVVETHSDFLIDRIRLAVAQKLLKPSDVVIHFMERNKGQTICHPIYLDALGNVLNAPPAYRRFFFDEMDRVMERA